MVGVLVDLLEYARKNELVTMERDLMVTLFGSGLLEADESIEQLIEKHQCRNSAANDSGKERMLI